MHHKMQNSNKTKPLSQKKYDSNENRFIDVDVIFIVIETNLSEH